MYMYMPSLYAQICYYSISLLLIHAKKIALSSQLYANGDMEDLNSQWNLMLIIVSTFLLSIMRI